MMKNAVGSALLIFLLAPITAIAQSKPPCLGSRDIASPDGKVIAHVTRGGRGTCGESKIEMFEADGHLLLDADYGSNDGEHGSGIVLAGWSDDSRYFVFSLSDQEDRAPFHYRVDVYRREGNHLRPLNTPKLTQPSFSFSAGDMLEVTEEGGNRVSVPLKAQ